MTKNTILAGVVVLALALGGWFYFKSPTPVVTPNTTNTESETKNNTEKTPTKTTNPTQTTTNIDVDVGVAPLVIREFTVSGKNFAFTPNQISVKKGELVRITFLSSSGMHDLRIEGYNVGTKVIRSTDSAEVLEFMADKTGTFEFYCSVGSHRQMGMVGKFIVTQ